MDIPLDFVSSCLIWNLKGGKMVMTTVNRALNSIGKKCFVDYYYQFKDCVNKNYLAQSLLKENLSATSLSAQLTRINYAQWIFENFLEKETLDIIIQSSRLDAQTIQRAKQIRGLLP